MAGNNGYSTAVCCFPLLSKFLNSLVFVTLLLLACDRLAAAEPPPENPAVEDELKQLNDQTIIQSRVFVDTEWDHFNHGAEKATWTLEGLWGWHVSEWQDWAVGLSLPFVYDRTDEPSGHADIGGLGDIEIGAGTAFRLNNTWRTGGRIILHTDTASDSAIGAKVWQLKPFWAIAHDLTNWFTLSFSAEYNHSIAEQHNVAPQRHLDLSLPATFLLPYNWSIFATYKTTIDFENGDRWTHTINAGVAKRLSNVPLVLSATLEKPLDGGAKKFQANFTITYYFKR